MTPRGKFIVGWFVVIILIVVFMVGVVGLFRFNNKTIRQLCGLMSFESMITLILVSNLL